MELREIGERKRNLEYDQSIKNPLYLQMNVMVKEVKSYFNLLPKEGLSIYDFGCGSKPYQVFSGSNRYIGIDIDKKNEKADIFSSIENVPVQNSVADIVCSFCVLEHVYRPILVLREKFRVLKSGGELFMLVPLYWEEHEQPYDYWRYTRFSLIQMLEEVGFSQIEIKAINANWAILGMHLAILFNSRSYTKFITPLINLLFHYVDQKILLKARSSGKSIANVMTYAVWAKK